MWLHRNRFLSSPVLFSKFFSGFLVVCRIHYTIQEVERSPGKRLELPEPLIYFSGGQFGWSFSCRTGRGSNKRSKGGRSGQWKVSKLLTTVITNYHYCLLCVHKLLLLFVVCTQVITTVCCVYTDLWSYFQRFSQLLQLKLQYATRKVRIAIGIHVTAYYMCTCAKLCSYFLFV